MLSRIDAAAAEYTIGLTLSRVSRRAPLAPHHGGQPRSGARRAHPGRAPLRPGAGEGAHPRAPGDQGAAPPAPAAGARGGRRRDGAPQPRARAGPRGLRGRHRGELSRGPRATRGARVRPAAHRPAPRPERRHGAARAHPRPLARHARRRHHRLRLDPVGGRGGEEGRVPVPGQALRDRRAALDRAPRARGPRAAQGDEGLGALFRRPPGHRQDLGRPGDRAGARAHVLTDQPRRDPRRGGHPGPPAHLRRRQTGPGDRGDPPRGVGQPGADARRARQDRPRGQGGPGLGAARGARPGAEPRLPRPLPRRALRPLGGALHRHGQPDGLGARGAARPARGHRVPRLHRGGEGADRRALPLPEAAAGEGTRRATR